MTIPCLSCIHLFLYGIFVDTPFAFIYNTRHCVSSYKVLNIKNKNLGYNGKHTPISHLKYVCVITFTWTYQKCNSITVPKPMNDFLYRINNRLLLWCSKHPRTSSIYGYMHVVSYMLCRTHTCIFRYVKHMVFADSDKAYCKDGLKV